MNMHKNTGLPPRHRQAIWLALTQNKESVTSLARRYMVGRVTVYPRPEAVAQAPNLRQQLFQTSPLRDETSEKAR